MNSKTDFITYAWLALIFIALIIIAVAGWANLQLVKALPLESEFKAKWEVTRGLIFRGENPYNNLDGESFTSPLPIVLFYSPFALIGNYELARASWLTVTQVATVFFVILSIRVTSWQNNYWLKGAIIIFALLWFPAFSVYVRGTETALIAVLFTAAVYAIRNHNDEIAGILLGLSALQPRVTLMVVLLVFLWAAFHHRWLLHFWAGAIFLLTSGIGMIFLPSWPLDFFWSTLRNVDFSPGESIIGTTARWWPGIGVQIGWGIIILALIILLAEWWMARQKKLQRLIWVLALSLIISIWIGIETNIDHIFMVILPLVVVFSAWNRRWGRPGQIFIAFMTITIIMGLWWAYIVFQRQGISGDTNPILMIGFPFLTLVGLYWARWWFLRPSYLDESQTNNE